MKRLTLLAVALFLLVYGANASAEPDLDFYLPNGVSYDPAIPKPSDVLGYEVGEWHVRHDLLVAYFRTLAAASDRVTVAETGRTHEARPLLLVTITAPANHDRLESIRTEHLSLTDPAQPMPDVSAMPAVVYMGYSVHGNEASGSNASLLVAYHLAAAQDEATRELLGNTVILLDPSLNPDGLGRFAHWANMYRGKHPIADPINREHTEAWPGGRTNHYWFDLNRDWLPVQHPESRARLETFHRWKPNVLTDHHEMGSDATYFFQPGVYSRKNPLTPDRNVELTEAIAGYHAAALDELNLLYYSQESFDDFYYGKGSTYPDANGAVGILFEQASSRGHLRDSVNGTFDFAFTIRNQFLTSLSTLKASLDLREDLLRYQRSFYETALSDAPGAPGGYVFGDGGDPARAFHLLDILHQHDIEVQALGRATTAEGHRFEPGSAWVVPMRQPQRRMVQAVFETRTTFTDSLFYDVSAWTLPLAMGLPYAELASAGVGLATGTNTAGPAFPATDPPAVSDATYAYCFSWSGYYAPRALNRLLSAGVRARVATKPFKALGADGPVDFTYGAIVVPLGIQDKAGAAQVHGILETIAAEDGVEVVAVRSGLTPDGVDLGSPSLVPLTPVRPLLVVGDGVSSYESGEAWHLLDQRFDIEVTLVDLDRLTSMDLHDYTHIVMVNGSYGRLDEDEVRDLKGWVRGGGTLVATKGAGKWAVEQEFLDGVFREDKAREEEKEAKEKGEYTAPPRRPYAMRDEDGGARFIGGAICEVDLDTTHPLGYGYADRTLPVFRNHRMFLEVPHDAYARVALYTEDPVLAGYVNPEHLEHLAGSAAVTAGRLGRGSVVVLLDNPNFRAFWYGTNRLFLNALFFGPVLDPTGN